MKSAAMALLGSRKFLISVLTVLGASAATFAVKKGWVPAEQFNALVGTVVTLGLVLIGAIAHEDAATNKAASTEKVQQLVKDEVARSIPPVTGPAVAVVVPPQDPPPVIADQAADDAPK